MPDGEPPGLLLGAIPTNPQSIDESRWQIADTFTVALPDWFGQHTFKGGFDFSVTDNRNDILPNRHGTFTFNTDEPYDPDRTRDPSGDDSYSHSARASATWRAAFTVGSSRISGGPVPGSRSTWAPDSIT